MSRAGTGAAANESPPARYPQPAPPRPLVAARGVVVTLPDELWNLAHVLGNLRQIGALWAGRKEATGGDPDDATANHVEGVAGEMGGMLNLNLAWTGIFSRRLDLPDLGRRIQIRATGCPTGHLIVQPKDNPADPFVLAIIEPPTVRLAGWMLGRDAKVDDNKRRNRNGAPVWWVPQKDLRPYDRAVLRWLDAAR